MQSPALWGVEAHLKSLFGSAIGSLAIKRRMFNFRYRSPEHFIEIFRTWYGPVHKAFAALPADGAAALNEDLLALLNERNRAADSLVVPSEYLEVVVTRA